VSVDLYFSLIIITANSEERDRQDTWHVCGKEEMHTRFWKESLREKDYLEDTYVDGRISLRIGRDGLDCIDVTEERDNGGLLWTT